MRANDVYCATVMWPRPSLGLPWGLPCPVPTPEALSTVLAWCTRRPSKVRTLVIHIIEFLLYTIAFSLALQSTRVSSSWLRGGLVLDPTERRYPPFIRVNASINRHKPRNSNPFTTEDPIVVLGSDDLSLIPFAISITLRHQALCFLRTCPILSHVHEPFDRLRAYSPICPYHLLRDKRSPTREIPYARVRPSRRTTLASTTHLSN